MLPEAARLRTRAEFTRTVRTGRRSGRRRLVVHHAARPVLDPALRPTSSAARAGDGARAGLVVSGAVGGSVVRKAVARRLRHVLAPVLPTLAPDCDLVVRALPAAAAASSAELARDLEKSLRSLGLLERAAP